MIFDAVFEKDLFTILRMGPGTRDALGKPTRVVVSRVVVSGLLTPQTTQEGEVLVVDEFKATMPLGTDLRPSDEVQAQGKTFEVQGTPFEAKVPKTKIGIITATLKYSGLVT